MPVVENANLKEEMPGRGHRFQALKLLEELEEYVESSKQVMNKALFVDLDEFFARTNRIKAAVPDEIKRAARITRESQRIGEDAKEEARRILDEARREAEVALREAREEAARQVDEHEITRLATEKGAEIIAQCERQADEIRRGALAYAREVLNNLEGSVTTVLHSIQNGQRQLTVDPEPVLNEAS
jgi:cell division septum initiation protein DivIVA